MSFLSKDRSPFYPVGEVGAGSLLPAYGESRTDLTLSPPWSELISRSSEYARSFLSQSVAMRYCALPLEIERAPDGASRLKVAFGEKPNAETLSALSFATSCELDVEHCRRKDVEKAIGAAYEGDRGALRRAAKKAEAVARERSEVFRLADSSAAEKEPVPAFLRAIIARAISLDASDIHLEPCGKSGFRLRYRVCGLLREESEIAISKALGMALSRRVKVLADLDTTVISRPQEGGFAFESSPWSLRLRVSILPSMGGEKVVFRLLDNHFLDELRIGESRSVFAALGMNRSEEGLMLRSLGLDSGSILLCGPTGSGKSTLLYAALDYLNTECRNIVTVEDPVERIIPGINQIQISRSHGLDYEHMLGPILRQDPDVIMLGEIRDSSTARSVLEAGLTGHLILSSVHAGNCMELLLRLEELKVPTELTTQSLRLLVSQRLIPKNCPKCVEKSRAGERLSRVLGVDRETQISTSRGCRHCDERGMDGRIPVFEFLPIGDSLRAAILDAGKGSNRGFRAQTAIREAARAAGYKPYAFSVREKLLEGSISPRFALRALGIAPELV